MPRTTERGIAAEQQSPDYYKQGQYNSYLHIALRCSPYPLKQSQALQDSWHSKPIHKQIAAQWQGSSRYFYWASRLIQQQPHHAWQRKGISFASDNLSVDLIHATTRMGQACKEKLLKTGEMTSQGCRHSSLIAGTVAMRSEVRIALLIPITLSYMFVQVSGKSCFQAMIPSTHQAAHLRRNRSES
jgi:hypothetical protein